VFGLYSPDLLGRQKSWVSTFWPVQGRTFITLKPVSQVSATLRKICYRCSLPGLAGFTSSCRTGL